MSWMFEDKRTSRLSELFTHLYSESVHLQFDFTGGIDNAMTKLLNEVPTSTDTYILVMDIIPDNPHLYHIYDRLAELSKMNNYRLLIIPIVCAEYNFIKSIADLDLITDQEILYCCLDKQPYYKYLNKFSHPRDVRTFEKFCKHILIDFAKDCVTTSRTDGKDWINPKFGFFCTKDCPCDKAEGNCKSLSQNTKALNYLRQFPCIPGRSLLITSDKLDESELWDLHREGINEVNKMIDTFDAEQNKPFIISPHYVTIK